MFAFGVVETPQTIDRRGVVDRQVQIDLLQTRIEARLRSLHVGLPDDIVSALSHDILNDAVQLALDWLEPTVPAKATDRQTLTRAAR